MNLYKAIQGWRDKIEKKKYPCGQPIKVVNFLGDIKYINKLHPSGRCKNLNELNEEGAGISGTCGSTTWIG